LLGEILKEVEGPRDSKNLRPFGNERKSDRPTETQ
jgi:hypothetical protein